MDLLQEIDSLKADYSAAQTLLEEAKASGDALTAQLAEKESALASKTAQIEKLIGAHTVKDKAIAELHEALAAMRAKEKSAEAKAVEIVANVGIKPFEAGVSEAASKTKAEIKAAYLAIKDPIERATYHFTHREALYDSGK